MNSLLFIKITIQALAVQLIMKSCDPLFHQRSLTLASHEPEVCRGFQCWARNLQPWFSPVCTTTVHSNFQSNFFFTFKIGLLQNSHFDGVFHVRQLWSSVSGLLSAQTKPQSRSWWIKYNSGGGELRYAGQCLNIGLSFFLFTRSISEIGP